MIGLGFLLCISMTQMDYTHRQVGRACDLMPLIVKESIDHGIDPFLTLSVIHVESSWRPQVVSGAGACGLMQVVPRMNPTRSGRVYTCKELMNPYLNIRIGVGALKKWIKIAKGDVPLGLCAYNAGYRCFTNPRYEYLDKVAQRYDFLVNTATAVGGEM